MRKRWFSKSEMIAIGAVVLFLVVLEVHVLTPIGAPWFPQDPPAEVHRVFHPKGFSIIPLPGWRVSLSDDGIGFRPSSNPHERYTPHLFVEVSHKRPVSPAGLRLRETTFAGQMAYEGSDPLVGGGDEPYFTYAVTLERNGLWYCLLYQTPNGSRADPQYRTIPESVLAYIRSFQLTEQSGIPQTQPVLSAGTQSAPQSPESNRARLP